MRPAIESIRKHAHALLMLLTVALATTFAEPAQAAGNLLAGRAPSRSSGVSNVKVLTDGNRANEGEEWNTTAAAVFDSEHAFVEFDLGRTTPIVAAYLQGDNNDEYVVTISDDRNKWTPLWTAPPRNEPGLRERWSDSLTGKGRYVRLTVRGGDRAYSATELQLFAERPSIMPPELSRVTGENQAIHVRTSLVYLAAAFAFLLFTTYAGSKISWLALGGLVAAAGVVNAYLAIDSGWPLAPRDVACFRGVAGAIGLLAVLRRALANKRYPAQRTAVTATLVVSALMASAAFYNLGRPQFWDHAHNRLEFVHTYDMRVYQPFAKYFKELQYDGVYPASVLAYAEDQRGGSLESMGMTEVRSLRDHRVRRVSEIIPEIRAVRERFSDERWAELKKDMRYFEDVMGPEFLGTLTDHGANATPLWVFFARLLLAHGDASDNLLTIAGLADAVLLSLLAIAMWRSFGLLPALVAVTVFGANDLYMFGTNWTGATLRHDWMVFLGLGACALKKERFVLAGICLGLATMIRAFPGAALIGVAIPVGWWIYERWQADGKFPDPRSVLRENQAPLRVLLSAVACMLFVVALTSILYSPSSWANWWEKVTLLNRDVGANEISLRALVAGADNNAGRVLQARQPIHVIAQIACFAIVVVLARKRPLHQAMLLSVPLALVLFNPSNYYSHMVFLLALLGASLAAKKSDATAESDPPKTAPLSIPLHFVGFPLLALCVAGYWSSLDPDIERHFQDETALLWVALIWLYANLLRRDQTVKSLLSS